MPASAARSALTEPTVILGKRQCTQHRALTCSAPQCRCRCSRRSGLQAGQVRCCGASLGLAAGRIHSIPLLPKCAGPSLPATTPALASRAASLRRAMDSRHPTPMGWSPARGAAQNESSTARNTAFHGWSLPACMNYHPHQSQHFLHLLHPRQYSPSGPLALHQCLACEACMRRTQGRPETTTMLERHCSHPLHHPRAVATFFLLFFNTPPHLHPLPSLTKAAVGPTAAAVHHLKFYYTCSTK